MNKFPSDKFNIKWLYNYSDKLIKSVAKNENIKHKVREQIEKNILEEDNIDNKLLKIYVKYFC